MYEADLAAHHAAHSTALAREAATTLVDEMAEAGVPTGTVADIGCGDGTLAALVLDAGYDVLAVDPSRAFLELVDRRAPDAQRILATVARMRLPGRLSAIACIGEVLSHDLQIDLDETLQSFHGLLRPGGILLFDVPGPGRHAEDPLVVHDEGGSVLIRRASESGFRLTREITLFSPTGRGRFRRSDEVHELRLYEPADVRSALARAGFVAIRRLDRYGARGPAFRPGWAGFIAERP